jgi:hypothetical protein
LTAASNLSQIKVMDILSNLVPPSQANGTAAPAPAAQSDQLHPLLADLVAGKIPGVSIPKGFKNSQAEALVPSVDSILKLGLKLFKPKVDQSVVIAVVNPDVVDPKALQEADEAGRVSDLLPSVTDFFPHEDQPATPANAPSNSPVSILPSPKTSPAVSRIRASNAAPQTPSDRMIPGGGTILNGLLKRPL